MKLRLLLILALFSALSPLMAAIQEKTVEYSIDGVIHEGFIAFDDVVEGSRPGILVIHEWKGISDHVRQSCRHLAELGYLAFAADIYGKSVRPDSNEAAAKLSGSYKKDRPRLRAKVLAGLEEMKKLEQVDAKNTAAIGYCFGGTTVLELARSGADVAGVVSFHGGLDSPQPADAKNIKGKVLVLHGAIDPHVPDSEVAAFMAEMRDAKVDWQLVHYGSAVHSFTSPAAGDNPSLGSAYHELTARRSWKAMQAFFLELFPKP
ncbi:MAG: dienelactone hydrolase [Candidatus Riflebacteria bacterium HGW-Riflebacteria-1]|jgi:dienelactone hydrolase|nr:MAG: dienelactone hydrolase [Candidatus Riflebacteria bacterium HGW-Riflebacteria-1]